jgi:hypothetical protein
LDELRLQRVKELIFYFDSDVHSLSDDSDLESTHDLSEDSDHSVVANEEWHNSTSEDKAIVKMTVFWDVVLCSVVEVYYCFRGAYCLHHQGTDYRLHSATSQKTVIFILTAMRT